MPADVGGDGHAELGSRGSLYSVSRMFASIGDTPEAVGPERVI
jgi:hypothetical protein